MNRLLRIAMLAEIWLGLCTMFGTAYADSTLNIVLQRGEFFAGITTDYPPAAYLDAEGHQVGYCADIARYLARRLGVKLAFVPVTALRKGDLDAAIVNQNAGVLFVRAGGLVMSKAWANSPDAIMVRQDDSKWRNWLNWALQRMWVEGTLRKLYVKWFGYEPTYSLGDYGEIQPRVMEIGKTDDPWNKLPDGFLDKLLGPASWKLD